MPLRYCSGNSWKASPALKNSSLGFLRHPAGLFPVVDIEHGLTWIDIPTALDYDLQVSNEETLEDLLRRFVSPVVNFALRRQPDACHFGRGSRYKGPNIPDWSVISDACLDSHTGARSRVTILMGRVWLRSKAIHCFLKNATSLGKAKQSETQRIALRLQTQDSTVPKWKWK